ncbi:MAG: MFS transporter, partial [Pseudomonadota bacterium]
AVVVGLMATLTAWLCFLLTDERGTGPHRHRDVKPPPVTSIAGDLLRNGPFKLVFAGVAVTGGLYGAELAMVPYLAKYWFGDPAVSRTLFTTQAVLSLASVPVWLHVGRRYGKHQIWIAGTLLAAAGLLAVFLLAQKSVWLAALFYGLSNVGATGFILVFYAMTADTVDWGEWQTGRRQEGVIFGAISFANKFAAGIATAGVGGALSLVGFVSDAELGDETLFGMRAIGLLAPAAAFVLSALLMTRYSLTRTVHADIVSARPAATETR